ncbi:uncharacterized protein si:cabz01007807.1 [Cololabis saira]|uniref:uncharacterized protein si:cabz01007807.1 n=1 Tax=Cololabis saira TaxID=129043 RepID=UPI002AD368A3|nr:uncharacterized protein si:cabz01007807.1 [Cololabis saira]
MLKKASRTPLRYHTLVSSSSDSSSTFANTSELQQDGDSSAADVTDSHRYRQNGVPAGVVTTNPFYANYVDPSSKSHDKENIGEKTLEEANPDAMFATLPSSPLDRDSKMNSVENGSNLLESLNIFQTNKHKDDLFQTRTSDQSIDVSFASPDLLSTSPAQTQTRSDLFRGDVEDLFHPATEDLFRANGANPSENGPSTHVDPFKSSLTQEGGRFQSPRNPFYSTGVTDADLFHSDPADIDELFKIKERKQDAPTKEKDLFGMSFKENVDIFAFSSTNAVDPFPSPLSRIVFPDVSSLDDPFSPSPSKQLNPLQDISNGIPDIFQPCPSEAGESEMTAFSTPVISSPSQMKVDAAASPELLRKTLRSPPAVPPKPLPRTQAIVLTSPHGSTRDILQPTPFSQAMSPSPSSDMTHAQVFRRPPRPLPRTRPPRPGKPPKQKSPEPELSLELEPDVPKASPKVAFRPLPIPAVQRKPKSPKIKPENPENYVVFEDVLLIGQERCVEDWPEDSPELKPEFKPSGKLKLRRESLKAKMDSDGGSGEDQDVAGTPNKRKEKKFKLHLVPRRGSKEKFTDDTMEKKSSNLPTRKSPTDFVDTNGSIGVDEDEEQYGMDYKKKALKTRVHQLFRRASTASVFEGKHESQERGTHKKSGDKNAIPRRRSEGNMLDDSTAEEEEGSHLEEKKKKKMRIKFVPHRGFAISVEKTNAEPKGAHGYTPRKSSKDKSTDEDFGSHAFTPREKPQDVYSDDLKEMKGQRYHSAGKAAFMDDKLLQKPHHYSPRLDQDDDDEDAYGIQDCKPKKPTKTKLRHVVRRRSKENMLEEPSLQRKKSSLSAEELDDEDLCKMKNSKLHKHKPANGASGFSYHVPQQDSGEELDQDEMLRKDLTDPEEVQDEELDEQDVYKLKKLLKLKVLKKLKPKSKAMHAEREDAPGATSSDYMSEAARAEWRAAQMDEQALAGLEDDDDEGDTDSLMEWWYTVEQWDEVPSDEEAALMKEDESKSFTILADKVNHGLRVFNKVFTERAEVLWQSIITLHTIAEDISDFHQKAKIVGITGGTTTAVGGVTAIAGLALAPFTFGASLVIAAVGVGVATAGGITSASAAISDNVNNMHDRKKVEVVLKDYEDHLLDIAKILHFVNQGLYKLRGHPFLRSGTQHYSEDWEIRRAVQMISLVDSPVSRATELADAAVASLQRLFKGMDKYFIKETRELKKSCRKEIVSEIREVANVLNDTIVELNSIREELQDATGIV